MTGINLTIRLTKKEKSTLQKLALVENTTMTNFIKSKIFSVEKNNEVGYSTVVDKEKNLTDKDLQNIVNKLEKYFIPIFQSTNLTYKVVKEVNQISQELERKIIKETIEATNIVQSKE
jgi:arsenate reductase-like glutaredoxin family protein